MMWQRRRIVVIAVLTLVLFASAAAAQVRRMTQDPALNNLEHPPGTATAEFGTLGRVSTSGTGSRPMLLIAGAGFGDSVWQEFMSRRAADYRMFAVTLPGFGGTRPLPMPVERKAYAEAYWIGSSVEALKALMAREQLTGVTVVAHWAVATQVALRLALEAPDRVSAVVLVAGALRVTFPQQPASDTWTPDERGRFMETLGERWFRTVTRDTWDDNNFMPYDYAVNPRRGLFLWREAQAPSLPVWVRYLLEYYALDLKSRLAEVQAPMLVVHPDFEDPAFYVDDPANNYMKQFATDSWAGVPARPGRLEFATVRGSRLFVMFDQPAELDRLVNEFLSRVHR